MGSRSSPVNRYYTPTTGTLTVTVAVSVLLPSAVLTVMTTVPSLARLAGTVTVPSEATVALVGSAEV